VLLKFSAPEASIFSISHLGHVMMHLSGFYFSGMFLDMVINQNNQQIISPSTMEKMP